MQPENELEKLIPEIEAEINSWQSKLHSSQSSNRDVQSHHKLENIARFIDFIDFLEQNNEKL